ncbi:bifunctional 3'-5' exonuclease/DNA polymerase [Isoptericola variabilis]|uniref:DNA-directed DNA polymerase n=1 Tax=Isoptericola variabilis (strain 225) TaxID=743718 RepID=F6FX28_ISOV2|nr:bifunctional 3'-5' exonuclease/DNA polymerase [Isoptericola variabilis]AEG44628.1 DNA-directed DNA polymerase [Isoptericola variabilis 225]TWH28314.1 DNA polymerase-1 [Isoptericola variabilis J7]
MHLLLTARADDLPAVVAEREETARATGTAPPRWTWDDTNRWYPALLRAGVRVDRAHDLRLAHRILRGSALAAGSALATAPPGPWDAMEPAPAGDAPEPGRRAPQPDALFELTAPAAGRPVRTAPGAPSSGAPSSGAPSSGDRDGGPDPEAELAAQLAAVDGSADPGRLRLLLAAESAGALVAAEMHHAGLPWRADVHDAILTEALGPRPPEGRRPERLEALAERIRAALDAPPTLNPDSHPDLLKAMQYAGVGARSLRKWELEKLDHPVVEPLLEYKNLYRLLTANGWHWLDQWVRDGRFRTEYVVGGVVTGRWASSGGGALQLPRTVRRAVQADPGWVLVVADAAQLEPRVLAGMAADEAMAAAGQAGDMYAGIVASGAVETRELAKVGMLGAMYGGTTGASAQVLPRLAATFPRAIALVEDAARTGERGGVVTTRLGRSSPPPGAAWDEAQAGAFADAAGDDAAARARSYTRSWGRFTRNFVVQGTAAEWALCWLASIRRRLWALGPAHDAEPGRAPAPFADRPHLVFFLHDEVVVHAPAHLADAVAHEVREAAAEAGRLLFGDFPVTFPLTVAAVSSYADAK